MSSVDASLDSPGSDDEPGLTSTPPTIRDVMKTSPRTCSPMSTALEAALVFVDAGCGIIPVIDMGKPVGVVTDRDLAVALGKYQDGLSKVILGDFMTTNVITILQDETLDVALDRLAEHGLLRLMVVDGEGLLLGVLSWSDIIPVVSEAGLGNVMTRILENRQAMD